MEELMEQPKGTQEHSIHKNVLFWIGIQVAIQI
jgi:hypothetical protein